MSINRIKKIFYMEESDKKEFNREITSYNKYILYAMGVITLIVECMTMSRIFIFSEVKLGSLNNRIYFGFYLVLIITAIFMLLTQKPWKTKKKENFNTVLLIQYIFICVYCIWSTAFNMYELRRNPYIWQYINCIIIAAVFLYLKPKCMMSLLVINHVVFTSYLVYLTHNGLDMYGNIVNSSIILLVVLFVSISRYIGKLQDFKIRKKLLFTNYELEKLNDKLNSLTITDSLSTLNNRRYFDEKLIQYWDYCILNGLSMTIIMMDIDDFKNFNDVYGHQAGDDCIVKISSVLRNTFKRKDDIVVRYGGEEFTAILINTTKENVKILTDNICKSVIALKMPNKMNGKEQNVTVSLGVYSELPNDADNATDFVEKADKALYSAKENGKNQVKWFRG